MSRTIKAVERHMIPQAKVPQSGSDFSLAPRSSSPNGSNADQKHFPDMHFESCAWPWRRRST